MTAQAARHGLHARLAARSGVAGDAVYLCIGAALAIAVSGVAAALLKQPLLFPSLGPTALLFFETPMAANASPRNALIGHYVALAVGFACVAAFGLLNAPDVLGAGVSPPRVGAAACSVALTGAILLLLRASHPPAGATTLIVSLGLLATPEKVLMMAAGIALAIVAGWLINRALGVPVPLRAGSGR